MSILLLFFNQVQDTPTPTPTPTPVSQDYTAGTLVYDQFGNKFIVKGVYYSSNNTKYYYVEDATTYFYASSQKCNSYATDTLGRQVTLSQPDCSNNGILRLLPDTSLSKTLKATKNNLFSINRR